jgi:protein O-GlcNAc transferase
MRRAYGTLRVSDPQSAQRILNYCLRLYPNDGSAHLLQAQQLVQGNLHGQALEYLQARVDQVGSADRVGMRLAILRLQLLTRDTRAAAEALAQLAGERASDPFDVMQQALYAASLHPAVRTQAFSCPPAGTVRFVVPCDDPAAFAALRSQVEDGCPASPGWSYIFDRCDERDRTSRYERTLATADDDVVVLLQKNVRLHNPCLVADLLAALESADVVGCWGARRWDRLDWRFDEFEVKAGGIVTASSEHRDMVECQLVGPGTDVLAPGMAVLNGCLLAIRPHAVRDIPFDVELERAETMLEEGWSNAAFRAGLRLAVHRNLGVFIDGQVELDVAHEGEARMRWADLNDYDPFQIRKDDFVALSVPLPDADAALAVCRAYFERAS